MRQTLSASTGSCRALLHLLGLFLFLAGTVEGHESDGIAADELTTTLKGGLALCAGVVALLLIIFTFILIVLCWCNCCKVRELQRLAFKDVEEGSGVELTKLEKKEEEETEEGEGTEGKDSETKVASVQLESEGENALSTFGHTESKRETAKSSNGEDDKEDKGADKDGEGKDNNGGVEPPAESQGGPHPIPVPPPISTTESSETKTSTEKSDPPEGKKPAALPPAASAEEPKPKTDEKDSEKKKAEAEFLRH